MTSRTKPSKKSETLEVRLSLESKAAFMTLCRQQGRTASEAVRAFVDSELHSPVTPRPSRTSPLRIGIAAAAAGLAVGAVAAPTLARPAWSGQTRCDHAQRVRAPVAEAPGSPRP